MIIDSSALIALVNAEPGADAVVAALRSAEVLRISAATWVELFAVADRRDPILAARLEALLLHLDVITEAVTPDQASVARRAFADFGKGKHPAGLKFGDCFAYALARSFDEALLFVGDAFRLTDIRAALGQPL